MTYLETLRILYHMNAAKSLGEQIRDARERRHMTQQQLADRLEVDRKTVDNWENGRTSPRNRMGALRQWAAELGGGEAPDPQELEIRELGARLGLSLDEQETWVGLYRQRKSRGEAERKLTG